MVEVMVRGVDTGLTVESVLPGPIKLHSKAAGMQRNLKTSAKGTAGRVITQVASYGFAMGEENARGHIIVTAPTAGSAGIIPAVVKSLRDLKTPTQKFGMVFSRRRRLVTFASTTPRCPVPKVVVRQKSVLVLPWAQR